MGKFYEPGDCFPLLKTANEQRVNGDAWREQLQLQVWRKKRDELLLAINELWKIKGCTWVNIWEEQWFPGIEQFLSDLQEMGYHIYAGSEECPEGHGQKQRRFCVFLDSIPGKIEWSRSTENEALL